MIKKLRLYQISLIAVSMLCIGLLAFMGITAIQRSLKLNISIPTNPSFVFKVGYKLDAGADYTYFFCNTILDKDGVSLANNVTLSGDTLSLHNLQVSGVGAEIFLKIINYTAVPTGEDYDFIKISGGGGNTGIEEFDESVNPYINDTAQTVEFSIYVASLDNGKVSIPLSFEWASGYTVTFKNMVDCTATNTTLPQNQDLLTTITPTTSFAENYFDYQITINGEEYTHYGHSGTLKIPAEDINGDIEISVGAYECWDGSSTTLDGDIDSAAEFQGATFSRSTVKLTKDLYLNNEDFIFDYDSGLVYVSDGVNELWLGTGVVGDASGLNSTFDTTPSVAGKLYASKTSTSYSEPTTSGTQTTYGTSGVLNIWTPKSGEFEFTTNGFDAQDYGVYGLYINNENSKQGLFGSIKLGIVAHLQLQNGYVKGGDYVGALCGYSENPATKLKTDILVDVTVIGSSYVGGITGSSSECEVYSNCRVLGNIIASGDYVGGITGRMVVTFSYGESNVFNCYNMANVYGANYVGGLVANLPAAGPPMGGSAADVISCKLHNSYSTGKIIASGAQTGRLVGYVDHSVALTGEIGYGELRHSYGLNLGDGIPLVGNTPYTSCGWFDNNLNVTAGEGQTLTYTGNLAKVLNDYVVNNLSTSSYYTYKYWDYDPTGKINNGYPYFVDELPEWYNG